MSENISEDSPEWLAGYNAATQSHYRRMLSEAIHGLGYKDAELGSLVSERDYAIASLREICGEFGDNDWPDNLDLSDIIQKHLGNHLFANRP